MLSLYLTGIVVTSIWKINRELFFVTDRNGRIHLLMKKKTWIGIFFCYATQYYESLFVFIVYEIECDRK